VKVRHVSSAESGWVELGSDRNDRDESMVTCKEFIEEFLAEYVDGALGQEAVAELEAHLAACRPCAAYLNTYRKTRDVVGQTGRVEMPPEMTDILREFMIKHLRRTEG
jgi:predicted anti-sigma-YlaC factor YlaD